MSSHHSVTYLITIFSFDTPTCFVYQLTSPFSKLPLYVCAHALNALLTTKRLLLMLAKGHQVVKEVVAATISLRTHVQFISSASTACGS